MCKFSTNLALSPGVPTQQNIFQGSECTKQTNHGGRRNIKCTEIQIQRALKLSNGGNQIKETYQEVQ